MQLWGLGLGVNVEINTINACDATGDSVSLQFLLNHAQLGYAFLDGDVVVGGGLQIARQRVWRAAPLTYARA